MRTYVTVCLLYKLLVLIYNNYNNLSYKLLYYLHIKNSIFLYLAIVRKKYYVNG